jgi:hypothetical protein
MSLHQKSMPLVRRATAYVPAFAKLNAALAKNRRSKLSDVERINRLRRAVFGVLPEDPA